MRRLSSIVFALLAACSAADDVTSPKMLVAPVQPSITFDRAVDVKLSTDRKGAQWTAPKVSFRRGSATGAVVILLAPAVSCKGVGGVYATTGSVRSESDTTFAFPLALCMADATYRTGTFTLTASVVFGKDTVQASTLVTVR